MESMPCSPLASVTEREENGNEESESREKTNQCQEPVESKGNAEAGVEAGAEAEAAAAAAAAAGADAGASADAGAGASAELDLLPPWAGAFGAVPEMEDDATARGYYALRFCELFFPDNTVGATEVRICDEYVHIKSRVAARFLRARCVFQDARIETALSAKEKDLHVTFLWLRVKRL